MSQHEHGYDIIPSCKQLNFVPKKFLPVMGVLTHVLQISVLKGRERGFLHITTPVSLTSGWIEGHCAAANPLSPGPKRCPETMYFHQSTRASASLKALSNQDRLVNHGYRCKDLEKKNEKEKAE